LLLARAGARVALVERSAYGTDTLSTHALMRAGVLQLSRWGLLDAVTEAGTPPVTTTTFHYADGESVPVRIRAGAGVPSLFAPRRYLLDSILVDAAASAGADVRHDTSVTGLRHDDDGRVTGVVTRDRAGRTGELPATLTVGADGIRSAVAEHVDAPVRRRGRAASAILYRYYADLPTSGYEWAYGRAAAAGLIPTNARLTNVFVGAPPERMRALRREHGIEQTFRLLLGGAAPGLADRVAAAAPAGRMHGWSGVPGFLRRSSGPGWALVGDAGYFKDPLTTHGITDALRDAELLSDAILEMLAGITCEAAALARYEATRNRLSRRLFHVTERIASYEWGPADVRTLLRRVSAAMSEEVDHLDALPARQPAREGAVR
jgi:flavin-dependent dehydrogenase